MYRDVYMPEPLVGYLVYGTAVQKDWKSYSTADL